MRIVHTADWHIGRFLGDYSLLEDQKIWFDQFLARLETLRPDALIVAGDIYDRSVPAGDAISLLNSLLCRLVLDLKIETFLISGNHDSRERLSFGSELLQKSGLHIAGTISRGMLSPLPLTAGGITANIYLLPYIEPHNVKPLFPERNIRTPQEAVAALTEDMLAALDPSAINILAAHGLFSRLSSAEAQSDAAVGGSELVNAAPFAAFDYVALGHLHAPRTAGSENIRYAGSPLKYSVDEANQQKSFTLLEIGGKGDIQITTEQIPPPHDVRRLSGSFEQLAAAPEGDPADYILLELTDTTMVINAAARLKPVYPNLLGVQYPNIRFARAEELSDRRAKSSALTSEELFFDFYEAVTGDAPDDDCRQLICAAFAAGKGGDDDAAAATAI